jgi:hypothetical protein
MGHFTVAGADFNPLPGTARQRLENSLLPAQVGQKVLSHSLS